MDYHADTARIPPLASRTVGGRVFCSILVFSAGNCIGLPKYVDPPVSESQLPVQTEDSVDSLALAAECLDRGDSTKAVTHLADHVRKNPDQVMFRSMLAEQFLKLGRFSEARMEFERSADEYRIDTAKHRDELIQCHTRLMQIAQDQSDEFAERFHRGAGLLLVIESWNGKEQDSKLKERTLSQALAQFRQALERKPDDAMANLMLGKVLLRMGQHAAARSAFLKANTAAPVVSPMRIGHCCGKTCRECFEVNDRLSAKSNQPINCQARCKYCNMLPSVTSTVVHSTITK